MLTEAKLPTVGQLPIMGDGTCSGVTLALGSGLLTSLSGPSVDTNSDTAFTQHPALTSHSSNWVSKGVSCLQYFEALPCLQGAGFSL